MMRILFKIIQNFKFNKYKKKIYYKILKFNDANINH